MNRTWIAEGFAELRINAAAVHKPAGPVPTTATSSMQSGVWFGTRRFVRIGAITGFDRCICNRARCRVAISRTTTCSLQGRAKCRCASGMTKYDFAFLVMRACGLSEATHARCLAAYVCSPVYISYRDELYPEQRLRLQSEAGCDMR